MRRIFCFTLLFLLTAATVEAASIAERTSAAEATALHGKKCAGLGDFYWEIGDAKGKLASGQIGKKYSSTSTIGIDSASKLVFGAYAIEKLGRPPTEAEARLLNMTAGYTRGKRNFLACAWFSRTIADCAKKNGVDSPTVKDIGIFSYGNPGVAKLAMDMGIGSKTRDTMPAEYSKYLGDDIHFGFRSLQLAGGLTSTPDNYARFLRKILSGKLRMKNYLGTHAVCAFAGDCPGKVAFSPAPVAWHYSLNHWVEDDREGDGAFSSAGLEGFYPWIAADKTTYGLVARQVMGKKSYATSAYCGMAIRKAWMTGTAQ